MPQPYNAAKCVEPAMIRKSRTSLESLLASASGIVARHVISKDGLNPFFCQPSGCEFHDFKLQHKLLYSDYDLTDYRDDDDKNGDGRQQRNARTYKTRF